MKGGWARGCIGPRGRGASMFFEIEGTNSRHRSKETHWCQWSLIWGDGTNVPLPQGNPGCCSGPVGYCSGHFYTVVPRGGIRV